VVRRVVVAMVVVAAAASTMVPATPAGAAAGAPASGFGSPPLSSKYDVREGGAAYDIDGNDQLNELAALDDGRLVAAGVTTTSDSTYLRRGLIARFTASGLLDPTFSADGWTSLAASTAPATAQGFEAVAPVATGGVVAAGWHQDDFGRYHSFIAKVTSTGTPDVTFGGGDGIVTLDAIAGRNEHATDVVITPEGGIVLGVFTQATDGTSPQQQRHLMKLTPAGLLDTTFGGGDGIVVTGLGDAGHLGAYGYAFGARTPLVALQGTSIVVAGSTRMSDTDADVVIERYLANGTLDASFGTTGTTTVDVDGARRVDHPFDLVVTTHGIHVGARTFDGQWMQGAVVALTTTGAPAPAFGGGDGSVTVVFPRMRQWEVQGLAVQPDGRVVLLGDGNDLGGAEFNVRVARMSAVGVPDPSFDGDGFAHLDVSHFEHWRDIVVSGGRLIAAGSIGSSPDTDIALGAIDAVDGPLPMASIADATMVEGEPRDVPQLKVAVTLSYAVSHRTRVYVTSYDIDTQYDLTHIDGAIVFEAGQTLQYAHVSVHEDSIDENDERFRLVLSAPERAGIADGEGIVTIVDEDPGPAITAASVRGNEGSSLTFEFRLSETSPAPIRFIAATQPGTATENRDYTYTWAKYEIPPGSRSATFTVRTAEDDEVELDETFRVRLYDVDNARSFEEPTGTIADVRPQSTTTTTTTTTTTDPSSATTGGSASRPEPQPARRQGYWMIGRTGDVHAFGDARWHGNTDEPAGSEVVDLEPTSTGNGYWTVTNRGQVYTHGDAPFHGGGPALATGETVTSLSRTATGRGYWLFSTRGRVFAYGDAVHHGDMAGRPLNGPVLDSIPTATGRGYYMVASDGGIFTFGDGRFLGSMGHTKLNAPVQSLVPDPDASGYWLVASDGGIFAFDAPFYGSMGHTKLNKPVTGMVGFGSGYLMVAEDGGIFTFGNAPFRGSLGDRPPLQPIVSAAVLDQV
jgi:uncharacterized delta-60 repeat protein